MVISIYKRVSNRLLGFSSSFLEQSPYTVRRNASTSYPSPRSYSSRITRGMSIWRYYGQNPVEGKNAESVKAMLADFGFNDTQITELARRLPAILERSTKKNLLPKLKFFSSIGVMGPDLTKLFLRVPLLLSSSLENQIIPCYNCLKNVPLSDDHVLQLLKREPDTFMVKGETVLAPNIKLLTGVGMPLSSVTYFILRYTRAMWRNHPHFKTAVAQAMAMGLNPSTTVFIKAVYVLCSISKSTWECKVKVFRSFGLSDDDIVLAYRKNPMIMALSEKKLTRALEFFRNDLRWAPEAIVSCPTLLELDMDRRIMPRCRIMEILTANGKGKKIAPSTFLRLTEEKFLNRFVEKYTDDLPELMDIYSKGMSADSLTHHIASLK